MTASRRPEVALESPRSQSVVHRDELDRHQARTTPEALLEEPNNPFLARPADVTILKDGSMLVSDEYNGAFYRISYVGQQSARR